MTRRKCICPKKFAVGNTFIKTGKRKRGEAREMRWGGACEFVKELFCVNELLFKLERVFVSRDCWQKEKLI